MHSCCIFHNFFSHPFSTLCSSISMSYFNNYNSIDIELFWLPCLLDIHKEQSVLHLSIRCSLFSLFHYTYHLATSSLDFYLKLKLLFSSCVSQIHWVDFSFLISLPFPFYAFIVSYSSMYTPVTVPGLLVIYGRWLGKMRHQR